MSKVWTITRFPSQENGPFLTQKSVGKVYGSFSILEKDKKSIIQLLIYQKRLKMNFSYYFRTLFGSVKACLSSQPRNDEKRLTISHEEDSSCIPQPFLVIQTLQCTGTQRPLLEQKTPDILGEIPGFRVWIGPEVRRSPIQIPKPRIGITTSEERLGSRLE